MKRATWSPSEGAGYRPRRRSYRQRSTGEVADAGGAAADQAYVHRTEVAPEPGRIVSNPSRPISSRGGEVEHGISPPIEYLIPRQLADRLTGMRRASGHPNEGQPRCANIARRCREYRPGSPQRHALSLESR